MLGHTDLKKGVLIDLDGAPHQVMESSHIAMGRGGAVMRTKLKNLLTGATTEKSFRSADKIESAELDRINMQFLYRDGDDYAFMNTQTYDQESLSAAAVGDFASFLTDGAAVQLLKYGERIVGLDVPNNVYLKVTETGSGARGDTATAALKAATTETGLEVMVPMFINSGDVIKVDTRTGAYLERQK